MEHTERHFSASDTVRDLVIGVADGLTVSFALAAGLSGVVTTTNLVVTAGVAEMAAGAIAMGLGGYLAARTDDQHYGAEVQRETSEIEQSPAHEKAEVAEILVKYGIPRHTLIPWSRALPRIARAGLVHDAFRTWLGKATSESGVPICSHHWRSLPSRRADPALAVHVDKQCSSGAHLFDRPDADRASRVRGGKGDLDWHTDSQGRYPNCGGRWHGCRCCVLGCETRR